MPTGRSLRWVALAVALGGLCGAATVALRTDDSVVARVVLLAEDGGRISGFDRALATAAALRVDPLVLDRSDGIDDVVVHVPPGDALVELEVVAADGDVASMRLSEIVEVALAGSRDEEIRILQIQIDEFEIALAELEPGSGPAERVERDIEIRRGQMAVLTGLLQVVHDPVVGDSGARPWRDGAVVALCVLLGVGVLVPLGVGRRR